MTEIDPQNEHNLKRDLEIKFTGARRDNLDGGELHYDGRSPVTENTTICVKFCVAADSPRDVPTICFGETDP